MKTQILKLTYATALLLGISSGQVTDAPNGITGAAPCIESYNAMWQAAPWGFDSHYYAGFEAKDGGVVTVGGSWLLHVEEANNSGTPNHRMGMIMKTNPNCKQTKKYSNFNSGEYPQESGCELVSWMTKIYTPGTVSQPMFGALAQDGSVIAVGIEGPEGGKGDQVIWKLDPESGNIIWKMKYDSAGLNLFGTHDGLEHAYLAPDGGLIVGGFVGGSGVVPQPFKSAGQIKEGYPFIAKISAADLNNVDQAPAKYEWSYYEPMDEAKTYIGSTKGIRVSPTGEIYALVGQRTTMLVLDPNGNVLIKTPELDKTFQASDLEIAPDGGVVLTGLTHPPNWTSSSGQQQHTSQIMKISPTGDKVWAHSYGDPPGGFNQYKDNKPDPRLVIEECFGMMATHAADGSPNGYVMSCGTGIEHCDISDASLKAECLADTRFKEWRVFVIGTDLDGNRLWSRMDNYQGGKPTDFAFSSAAEHVFPMTGGRIGVITDEAEGMGVLIYKAPNGQTCPEIPDNSLAFAQTGSQALAQSPNLAQFEHNHHQKKSGLAQRSIKDMIGAFQKE